MRTSNARRRRWDLPVLLLGIAVWEALNFVFWLGLSLRLFAPPASIL